jgi:YtcA family
MAAKVGCVALVSAGLAGCALRGAPSYSIFGAFFPAWLLCACLGIFASILLRSVLIAADFEEAVPFKLLVYLAFAVGATLWLWLALFGES